MSAEQSKTPNLDRLREMSERLSGLVAEPEVGTMMWNVALDVVLADLAAFRGHDKADGNLTKSYAQIGASVFAPGVAVSTVIDRAYREYQHQKRAGVMAEEGQDMALVPRSLLLAVADLLNAMNRRNAR